MGLIDRRRENLENSTSEICFPAFLEQILRNLVVKIGIFMSISKTGKHFRFSTPSLPPGLEYACEGEIIRNTTYQQQFIGICCKLDVIMTVQHGELSGGTILGNHDKLTGDIRAIHCGFECNTTSLRDTFIASYTTYNDFSSGIRIVIEDVVEDHVIVFWPFCIHTHDHRSLERKQKKAHRSSTDASTLRSSANEVLGFVELKLSYYQVSWLSVNRINRTWRQANQKCGHIMTRRDKAQMRKLYMQLNRDLDIAPWPPN
jgi:hypothetical protein